MELVRKRMSEDRKLRHQKKAQAVTSIVGGTLGLTGLGLLAAKRPVAASKVTTVGAGVGGVGAFNFASIQNKEAKKRGPKQTVYVVRNKKQIKNIKSGLEPVTKGLATMDFGLGDVHQGENVISKRKWDDERSTAHDKKSQQAASVASGGVLAAYGGWAGNFGAQVAADSKHLKNNGATPSYRQQKYNLKGQFGTMKDAYKTATTQGYEAKGKGPIPRRKTVKPMLKFGARAMRNNPHAVAGKASAYTGLAGVATAVGGSVYGAKQANKATEIRTANRKVARAQEKAGIAKRDWMNISEHERRARDSRRTKRRSDNVAGLGGAAVAGAVGHRAMYTPERATVGEQASRIGSSVKGNARLYKLNTAASGKKWDPKAFDAGLKRVGSVARANKHGAAGILGATALAGGVLTGAGARVNEKRHDRAVSRLRRERAVAKAYNPEERRLRRLDHTATAMSAGSGAATLGAAAFGRSAVGSAPKYSSQWSTKEVKVKSKGGSKQKVYNVHAQGTRRKTHQGSGFRAKNYEGVMHGLKNSGKAGALGLTAAGLAVGSDRVRSYKHGRGGSYRALHRGS